MKNTFSYSLVQLKRMIKILPKSIGITLFLSCCIALLGIAFVESQENSEEKTKISIGLVGNLEESYMGFGIRAIQTLDSSRFTIEFVELEEQEAIKRVEQGNLNSYIKVPDGFLDAIMQGELKPLLYVSKTGNQMLSGMIVQEVVKAVSILMRDTQNAVFAMQDYIRERELREVYTEHTNTISIKYLDFILARPSVFEVEQIGVLGNQLSVQAYYVGAFSIVFLLLWGIMGALLFIKKDMALYKMLKAKGQKELSQIVGEWIAYVLLMLGNVFVLFFVFTIIVNQTGVTLPEWKTNVMSEMVIYGIFFVPVIVLISAIQFLLFELSSDFVSGILLQFLSAITLAYLSGCFYPLSFFPKSIEIIANVLPTKIAFDYLSKCFLSQQKIKEVVIMMIYTGVFLLLTVCIRKRRL